VDVGIPAEQQSNEYRVGLTPHGVRLLTQAGHRAYIEQGAGEGAGFRDLDYERAGGQIVFAHDEVYQRADLVTKVGSPTLDELDALHEGQTICAFWHLAAQRREVVHTLLEKNITAVAYENIQRDDGVLPVLRPLSEIAGRMLPQIAARWLQNDGGGNGYLIGGLAGIPPIDVTILGAGAVGLNATRAFYGLGARVSVLDCNLERLELIDERFGGRVTTMVAYDFNIARALKKAKVLVGAVLVPGERAPVLVSREMVRSMHPRSVIIDVSIDQGGCVETSRLTNHTDPVFVDEDVIHYCVPNIPGVVARTSTHAYLNAAWPFIQELANQGAEEAIGADSALQRGVAVHGGQVVSQRLMRMMEGR
jgi:alanine dehydrogenase